MKGEVVRVNGRSFAACGLKIDPPLEIFDATTIPYRG